MTQRLRNFVGWALNYTSLPARDGSQRAVIQNWSAMSGTQAQAMVSEVQSLMSKARGIRESVEVLVRSDIQNSARETLNKPVSSR